jgi:hypothetical protein
LRQQAAAVASVSAGNLVTVPRRLALPVRIAIRALTSVEQRTPLKTPLIGTPKSFRHSGVK